MMKTSFTKLFKEKWKAILPFLFFCMMSPVVKAEFDTCGKSDSIAQFKLVFDCDGALTVVADIKSDYAFGVDGGNGDLGTFTQTSGSLQHFASTHLISGVGSLTIYIKEKCTASSGSNKTYNTFYAELPRAQFVGGNGAGTWSFTGVGKTSVTAGLPTSTSPTSAPTLSKPSISSKVTLPSCTTNDDGQIELSITGLGDGKCASGITFDLMYAGVGGATVSPGLTFTDGKSVITHLKDSSYVISFSAGTPSNGCLCMPQVPDDLSIIIPTPSNNTASVACISKINVSASRDADVCQATISLTDIAAGISDLCNDNDMVEYITVKDQAGRLIDGIYRDTGDVPIGTVSAGSVITGTGSGFSFAFANAAPFFGQEVIVEVQDSLSGNLCWGTALIEDKSPPVVSCDDAGIDTILCIDFKGNMEEAIKPAIDDCSNYVARVIEYKEITDCATSTSILKRVQMVYFAEDEWGNKSDQCRDTIDIMRIGQKDISGRLTFIDGVELILPNDFAKGADPFACDDFSDLDTDGVPDPTTAGAGFPQLRVRRESGGTTSYDMLPLPALNFNNYTTVLDRAKSDAMTYCKIGASYRDIPIGTYDCVTKIMRQWTIGEWSCHGELDTTWTQMIDIVDTIAPKFDLSTLINISGSVNSYNCLKSKPIPMPRAYDNCADDSDIEIQRVVFDSTWRIIGPDRNMTVDEDFDFPYGHSYVVYTAFDACHNYRRDTIQVNISDETPPVTICKDQLVVGISGSKGSAEAGLVNVRASSFDNGSYDDCGLRSTCVVRMQDLARFDSLDMDNDGWVPISQLPNELACDRSDYYAQYARVIPHSKPAVNGIHRDDLCQKEIWFCCNDDGNDVMVIFRAEDFAGNINECMVSVDIQDKTTPTIVCPVDISVDCESPLPSIAEADVNVWINITDDPTKDYYGDLFGKIVREHSQKPFGVHPDHVDGSIDLSTLVDGLFFDNCDDPDVYVRIRREFDQCRTGEIIREFYVEDNSGNRSEICRQVITVKSKVEFNFNNIIWPVGDTSLTSCMRPQELSAVMFGRPSAPDGACMLFGTSYEDQIFRFNNQDNPNAEACFKMIRTWNVIDWCKNSRSGHAHTESFEQVIKVNDPDGPAITCNALAPIETFECDGAIVELTANASDECTDAADLVWSAKIDAFNDGSYDYSTDDLDNLITSAQVAGESVATLSRMFPSGTHKITWIVEDKCGNLNTCSNLFTVTNVKNPIPFATNVSTVLMSSGMVSVWSSDLDAKSEHPCYDRSQIQTAIVRTGGSFEAASGSITFVCEDYQNGPDVLVDFYAFIDLGGGHIIKDYTTVTVTLQDNHEVCNSSSTNSGTGQNAYITGSIRTENAEAVSDISIDLLGGNQGANAYDATSTDATGAYAFPAMPIGEEYTIDPLSNDDYLNGVTTLDLVLIQRYILGISDLESAYKIIAADINNDRSISAIDLVDLRRVILGITSEFSNNESWRFVDAEYEFMDQKNPLNEPVSENYGIATLEANMNVNFIGLKVGDVDGSADAASTLAKSRSIFTVELADANYAAGDIISVPVRVKSDIDIVGLQFTADFDVTTLIFAGVDSDELNVLPEHVAFTKVDDGIITISWNDVNGQSVGTNQSMMTLNFKAIQSGKLSDALAINSSVTAAEIYNAQLETMNIVAKFNSNTDVVDAGFELYQNTPNPFAQQTMITFQLPQASIATLSIFDVTGKLIKVTSGSFDKGINTIELSKEDLSVSGVLFYTLEAEEFTDTKRMVVLK